VTALCAVPECRSPVTDARLCRQCGAAFVTLLRGVPGLVADLDLTLARRGRTAAEPVAVRRAGGDQPLPYRFDAAAAGETLRQTLNVWTHAVAETRSVRLGALTPVQAAGWLLRHRLDVRRLDDAAALVDEVTYAVTVCREVIDREPERVYAGPCDECRRDLYGWLGVRHIRCRFCEREYDLNSRREWLLESAMSQRVTAGTASRALPGLLGEPVSKATIEGLIRRGRLPSTVDADGRRRFRVGALVDLLRQRKDQHAQAHAKE
jgi:hypothetical protein